MPLLVWSARGLEKHLELFGIPWKIPFDSPLESYLPYTKELLQTQEEGSCTERHQLVQHVPRDAAVPLDMLCPTGLDWKSDRVDYTSWE